MFFLGHERKSLVPYFLVVGLLLLLLLWLAARTFGQDISKLNGVTGQTLIQNDNKERKLTPLFTEYRGIGIGTAAEEIRSRLDENPKSTTETELFFVLSDSESAQFVLDGEKKVKLISVTYSDGNANAPTYEQVFGKDIPVKTLANGNIYNRVSYPTAGYWVAYYSSADKEPTVTITIQRL